MSKSRLLTHLRIIVIAALSIVLVMLTSQIALASPMGQIVSGEITGIEIDEELYIIDEESDEEIEVFIKFEMVNTGGDDKDFRAHIEIIDPLGETVYDSEKEDEDRKITRKPQRTGSVGFRWIPPDDSEEGVYTVIAKLMDWRKRRIVYDDLDASAGLTFEIRGVPELFISPDTLSLGRFMPGETPFRNIAVRNIGKSTLEWSITHWPAEWVEIVEPTPNETIIGPGNIRIVLKKSAPLKELRGSLTIESNASEDDTRVLVTASVDGEVGGEIIRLKIEKPLYRQGEQATVTLTARNTGELELDYLVEFTVLDPSRQTVYSSFLEVTSKKLSLEPEEQGTAEITWEIAEAAPIGNYQVSADLRYWYNRQTIFDRVAEVETERFRVAERPVLSIEPQTKDFGSVSEGEVAFGEFELSNASGFGSLNWEIVGLPEWAVLAGSNKGKDNATIRIETSPSAVAGEYSGTVEIVSNGGTITLNVSAVINASATATPTQTAAPPATTPIPVEVTPVIAEPTFTPTPEQQVQDIPTPTATLTPLPTAPTATYTPEAEPTPESTAEPSNAKPQPPAQAVPAAPLDVTPEPPVATAIAPSENTSPPEAPSGGGCGAAIGRVSATTSAANTLMLLLPIGLLGGLKFSRRRRCKSVQS